MISLEDRTVRAQDIDIAHRAGARLSKACAEAGIDVRTLQRWKAQGGLVSGDRRPAAVRPTPAHALSVSEREQLLRVANEPRFADLPPARIVPALADEGVYLASESSFHRVLRAQGQNRHRGRAKAPRASRPPTTHVATAPRQLWSWDMTYLPAEVLGRWFYLYLILDVFSRKIVGFEVHDTDDSLHAAHLAKRTALAEGLHAMKVKPVLHGDNGRRSRRRRYWQCCTGSGSSRRTRDPVSATTTRSSRACFAPRSTGQSSRPRASPTSGPRGRGRASSCIGTTTSTVTAVFAT